MAKSKRAQQLQKMYIAEKIAKDAQVVVQAIQIAFGDREAMKHKSWCFKNDILIYAVPMDYKSCKICIEIDGKPMLGEHYYKSDTSKLKKGEDDWNVIINKLYTQKYLERNEI